MWPCRWKGKLSPSRKVWSLHPVWVVGCCRLQMVLESVCRAEESGAESRRGDNTPPCRHRCSAAVPSHTTAADTWIMDSFGYDVIVYDHEWVLWKKILDKYEDMKRLVLVFWAENQARRAQYGQSFSLLIKPIENLQLLNTAAERNKDRKQSLHLSCLHFHKN